MIKRNSELGGVVSMAANRRGKRFYFSGGQLILLGAGFMATSVIIFLLGMLVGKGIEEGKMVRPAEPVVKVPVKPSAEGEKSAPVSPLKEEMTFYDTLTQAPAPESTAEEKNREGKVVDKGARAEAKELKPESKLSAQMSESNEAPPTEKVSSIGNTNKKEVDKTWTVQVNAFPDQNSAMLWVDRLKNKGYNAYVTEIQVKGKVWYRVRVGHYDSREEAEKVEVILKNKENLPKAFATSR